MNSLRSFSQPSTSSPTSRRHITVPPRHLQASFPIPLKKFAHAENGCFLVLSSVLLVVTFVFIILSLSVFSDIVRILGTSDNREGLNFGLFLWLRSFFFALRSLALFPLLFQCTLIRNALPQPIFALTFTSRDLVLLPPLFLVSLSDLSSLDPLLNLYFFPSLYPLREGAERARSVSAARC